MLYIFLAIIIYLLPSSGWFRRSGIPVNTLRMLLLLQICAGLAIGWYTFQYHADKDYWSLHREGLAEYELLKKDPVEFIKSIAYSPYENKYGHFFSAVGSFWNDLRNNIMAKILALLNLISNGNYYINSLFFNIIAFIGHLYFYRLFILLYPQKKNLLLFTCFLLPSVLIFVAGIHKDILIFTALAVFCYQLYHVTNGYMQKKRILALLISWLVLLTMRNFLAMVLLPLTIIYFITEKRKINAWLSFGGGFLLMIGTIFFLEKINAPFQPAAIISQRQADFYALAVTPANIKLKQLEPTIGSLLTHLPEAINHGLFRPYPMETTILFTQIMSCEWWLYLILITITSILSFRKWRGIRPLIAFFIILSVTMLVVSGWIVPNLNAIIRYRSLYLPLLLTPFLVQISIQSKHINL